MRRKVAAALVVALALALVGCGGSEKTEVVSRAQAVTRLEAACLAGQRAARARLHGTTDKTVFVAALRENLRTIMDRVGNLETTGSAKADFDAFKATVRTRLDALDRIADADRSDWPRLMSSERRTMEVATNRAHVAIVGLRARHVCV
jgi:hypothetical protein